MKMKLIKKVFALVALVAFISVSLSSCHRYGCPGQVQNDVEITQNEKC